MKVVHVLPRIRELVIWADRDPAGRDAAEELRWRHKADGGKVRVLVADVGNDANDELVLALRPATSAT